MLNLKMSCSAWIRQVCQSLAVSGTLMMLAGCGSGVAASPTPVPIPVTPPIVPIITEPPPILPLSMLRTEGTRWVKADGSQINLKGVNLGNWLMQEFWMMGQGSNGIDDQCKLEAKLDERFGYAERERLYSLFRQNWISTRDWDMIAKFRLNAIRLPFIWSVIEDEKNPGHLRANAWQYLDDAIAQAEARGMYVILDLHGAVGAQGWEHHSGCAGKNLYWSTPEFQDRTVWLWQQIATRYKDHVAVAGYSVLNEPWGATEATLATVVKRLYSAIRAIDNNHVVILPGHNSGINGYGKPSEQGMKNVAFEMHFYPGMFGWGQPGVDVHKEWLQCGATGKTGVCEWNARLLGLNTAFFIGEFQPWASMGPELGGQVARATYDAYASYGWASTSWSYKIFNNTGGQGSGTWGLVTNAAIVKVPALDFATAPLSEIEALFKLYGTAAYEPQQAVMNWMSSSVAPAPFAPVK